PTLVVLVAAAAAGAAAGRWPLAAVLIVEQAALAWAWTLLLGAAAGTVTLMVASAVACDLAVLLSDGHGIGSAAGVVGVALAATVLYQLGLRRARPVGAGPAAAAAGDVSLTMAAALGGAGVTAF